MRIDLDKEKLLGVRICTEAGSDGKTSADSALSKLAVPASIGLKGGSKLPE